MGEYGPIAKRSEERRRQNKPDGEVINITSDDLADIGVELPPFVRPEVNPDWPEPIRRLWQSAESSMFSVWYQPSDWALLYATLDEWAVEVKPRPVQVGTDDQGFPEYRTMRVPIPGAKLTAFNKVLTALLFDEGGRRRLRMELTDKNEREKRNNEPPATVTQIKKDLLA